MLKFKRRVFGFLKVGSMLFINKNNILVLNFLYFFSIWSRKKLLKEINSV